MRVAEPTAAVLIIGSEVLSGKVRDENTPYLVDELRRLGVQLGRVVIIPDDVEVIAREVLAATDTFDWVFTAGGLGPTHDDVTVEAVARAFGRELVTSAELSDHLDCLKPGPLAEGLRRLTVVPEGAGLYWGEGPRIWPTVHVRNVYILPGVPSFLRARFTAMADLLRATPFVCHAVLCAWPESELIDRINRVVSDYPEVAIGSYPQFGPGDHRVKITFDARDRAAVDRATDAFVAQLPREALVRVERQAS